MAPMGWNLAVTAVVTFLALSFTGAMASNFRSDFDITWGGPDNHAKFLNGDSLLQLTLDNVSGSAFQSKAEYLFGRIDMQIKLVPGNSAGTVTAYYLSSLGPTHDEVDFEFLGNVTGQPYTVHTNVFSQGKGDREQQFRMWFDPTMDFHTYSILWNPIHIVFLVDNVPIREFKNNEAIGVPYLKSQPMRIYSSLWNASDWATQGGRIKADFSNAPFVASYQNYLANACVTTTAAPTVKQCGANTSWMTQDLTPAERAKLAEIRTNNMIYNYCTDYKRFPQGVAPECTH